MLKVLLLVLQAYITFCQFDCYNSNLFYALRGSVVAIKSQKHNSSCLLCLQENMQEHKVDCKLFPAVLWFGSHPETWKDHIPETLK